MAEQKSFKIEGTRILFPNFEGKKGRYTAEGDRNFCVVLTQELADQLDADGWNVKYLEPYEADEDGVRTPYIKVKVSYKIRPPRVVMMTDKARTSLTEDSVAVLDYADIASVDLICNGSDWTQPDGKFGTTAYLKTLFVLIEEDDLERKYDVNTIPNPEAD